MEAPGAVKAKPTVKDDSHGPEVHAGVVVLPTHHLGGHVERGAAQHVLLIPRGHVLSKAEICQAESSWGHREKRFPPCQPLLGDALTCQLQLGVLRGAQEDVLRLQVQVGDVVVVEELQGTGWAGGWACESTALHPKTLGEGPQQRQGGSQAGCPHRAAAGRPVPPSRGASGASG